MIEHRSSSVAHAATCSTTESLASSYPSVRPNFAVEDMRRQPQQPLRLIQQPQQQQQQHPPPPTNLGCHAVATETTDSSILGQLLPLEPLPTISHDTSHSAMIGTTFDGSDGDECDDDDDDDDSYHDLDAVMALVAATADVDDEPLEHNLNHTTTTIHDHNNSSNSCSNNSLRMGSTVSGSSAAAAVAATYGCLDNAVPVAYSSSAEECKEEISQAPGECVPPLPLQFATIHASSIPMAATQEATVLLEPTTTASASLSSRAAPTTHWQRLNYIDDEDSRLAAHLREEEELLLALKLSAYEGGGSSTSRSSSRNHHWGAARQQQQQRQMGDEQRATVVEISEYEARFYTENYSSGTTAHAEWIGQDYSTPSVTAAPVQNRDSRTTAAVPASTTAAAVMEEDDETREAMVIDSAPLEKQDESVGFTEEAQILVDGDNSMDDTEDRKPAAVRHGSFNSRRRRTVTTERQEAEVLAIQEQADIHPAEYAFEWAARAELVGTTDETYTVAVPSSSQTSSAVADRAAVMSPATRYDRLPTPPEAVAFVTPGDLTVTTTTTAVASVVTSDTSFDDFQEENDLPIEEAQVISQAELGYTATSRRLAGLENARQQRHGRNQSRSSLSVIAEQEGEVVCFQEDQDMHPELCREHRLHDPEAELVALDPSCTFTGIDHSCISAETTEFSSSRAEATYTTPPSRTSSSEASIVSAATMVDGAVGVAAILASNDYFSSMPLLDRKPAPSIGRSTSAFTATRVPAEQTAGVTANDVHEVHRAGSANADLVDSVNDLNANSTALYESEGVTPVVATMVAVATSAIEADGSNTETLSTDQSLPIAESSPVILASAFTDPHQPFVSDTNDDIALDEDIARALDENNEDDTAWMRLSTSAESIGSEQPISSLPVALQPPSTSDTVSMPASNEDIDTAGDAEPYSYDWMRSSTPDPQPVESSSRVISDSAASDSNNSTSSQRSIQTSTSANIQMLSHTIARGTSTVLEALFGDSPPPFALRRSQAFEGDKVKSVLSRTLLPWSVIHNRSTKMWIATLQTNQKALDKNDIAEASKSLRAFSMPSENQALSLARSWTPPRMLPFDKHKFCHICKSKFALLRRACHCRNCGVCICKECTVQWPAKMIPDTYNIKKEHFVNACKSCNWLSDSFRLALLEGDRDRAVTLYATGNVNLHTPFANVKGELFYPVHCAVLGSSLDLLKFLVDDNCCPIKSVRVAGTGKESGSKYTPIVTSKGRSLLGIAMENESLHIVRYLVAQKGIMLSGERDVTSDLLCRNFEKLLRHVPEDAFIGSPSAATHTTEASFEAMESESSARPAMGGDFTGVEPFTLAHSDFGDNDRTLSEDARDFGAQRRRRRSSSNRDAAARVAGESVREECIICFDHVIDCIATPCGHAVCCLECSSNLSICPVCNGQGNFIKIFRP